MFDITPYLKEFEAVNAPALVRQNGYYLFEQKLDAGVCSDLCERIDELAQDDDVEVNYGGSEHRIWHASSRDEQFAPFEQLSNRLMPELYGRESEAHNVLAIRNRPRPPSSEREHTRWHLDSFRKQLKLFAFLTDVTEKTGPFEVVEKTHAPRFKWSHALPLGYYRLSDFMPGSGKKRSWQYIHDDTVDGVTKAGHRRRTFNVPAGTVALVDTSAIHRAKPCEAGQRYAVTVYHR